MIRDRPSGHLPMSTIIETLEQRQLRDVPAFKAGDTLRVHFKVIEGNRQRVQVFEGICIKRQGSGARETFTVRKNSFGVGVERTFPLHSPKIEKLEVAMIGDVNRAKLYYLRGRVGKKSFSVDQLEANTKAFIDAVLRAKPAAAKGKYVKSAHVTSTMGPGIALDEAAVAPAEA